MAAIPIRELSHHTARAMARVKAGETVEITERGKVIGRIIPVDPTGSVRDRLIAQGRLRPATGSRTILHARLRQRLATESIDTGNTATETLQVMREEERY
ncbi:type II toxin-antitoxin system prevent-host-death family antitoxin [Acrocarpospora sp. B8E8]|uniref:type II toxin-antitoxin system Phd/YefM family antitoxin n=1 Tax=Acrocarpospora sp. B8E8 TaxID=3153572 RepID=UPI00325C6611